MPLHLKSGILLLTFVLFTTFVQAGHLHRHLRAREVDGANVKGNAQQLASDLDRVKSSFNAFSSDFWNYMNNLGSRMSAIEQYLGLGSSVSSSSTASTTAASTVAGTSSILSSTLMTSQTSVTSSSLRVPTAPGIQTSASIPTSSVQIPTAPGLPTSLTTTTSSPTSTARLTTSVVATSSSAPLPTTGITSKSTSSPSPVRAGLSGSDTSSVTGIWTAVFPSMSQSDIDSLVGTTSRPSSSLSSSSVVIGSSAVTSSKSSAPAQAPTGTSRPISISTSAPNPSSSSSSRVATSVSPSAATSAQAPSSTGAFNALSNQNLAVYYGQTPSTTAQGLGPLCSDPRVNIVILAFVPTFFAQNNAGYPSVEFGPACYQDPNRPATPGLLNCNALAPQIQQCQAAGKKVFASLGGYIAQSSFASDAQAAQFARTLWDLFGAGARDNATARALRPFGPDVVLDGFDVDNEDHSTAHWGAFASALRTLYKADAPRQYFLSAAPQCPRPDASVPAELYRQADFVWVQFYNNPSCDLDAGTGFLESASAWAMDLAQGSGTSTGSAPRFFVGMGAWPGAGQGYVDGGQLTNLMAKVKGLSSNFGGIMLWDGTVGEGNGYIGAAKDSLKQ